MSKKIKFGTDGWRAIIADDYTVENVARVTVATAEWLKQNFDQPSVVIGHDCRFSGALFTETAVKVFINAGIPVKMAIGFVSTPMVSLGAVKLGCSIGVVITASHNPPSYNGFKLKSHHGGPLSPEKVQEVEDIIPEVSNIDLASISMDSGLIEVIDLETMYVDHAKANFDLDAIEKSGLVLAYDAMYGSGQNALKRLLPNTHFLHCENNPSFMGQAPEPIAKNLQELESFIKERGDIDCALATDGDADRIGLYNGSGEFIDSHHIILLLIHYLKHYKGMTGKVATAFSTTPRVKVMIWMGLIIWEFMAKSGKTLDDLIREVYEIVGPFKFERSDLHITEELKQKIVANCKADHYKSFGEYQVKEVGTIDGFKYFFDENRWVMIRPSGTEPVLRTYAEAPTMEEVRKILQVTKETICG